MQHFHYADGVNSRKVKLILFSMVLWGLHIDCHRKDNIKTIHVKFCKLHASENSNAKGKLLHQLFSFLQDPVIQSSKSFGKNASSLSRNTTITHYRPSYSYSWLQQSGLFDHVLIR